MRGSIVKKGSVYYAVIAIGSKRKWIKGGDTRKDAERVLNENLPSAQNGTFRDIKKTTFAEFGKIWIDSYVATNIKETAQGEYKYVVGRFTKHFGNALLQNITGAHIQTFIVKRLNEVEPSTTQRDVVILKEMLKHAYQWGYTNRNPGEFIKNPRISKKEVTILDINEAYKFLEKMHPHYHVAVLTAILTGLRANELWGLTWDDIDLNTGTIHVRYSLWKGKLYEPKTETSKRRIDISNSLALELKKWKLQCPVNKLNLVFPSKRGKPVIHSNFVKCYFNPALQKAEATKVKWHSVRHTNASVRIRSEQNPKYLSQQLGHSSIKITYDLYGHLFNDADFSKSQVAKLENTFYGR
ncbi:MAG: site-specific integrase [Proteobacteria bacterium]|nr:site-specific integrase [Pseudomonadota bacterium]